MRDKAAEDGELRLREEEEETLPWAEETQQAWVDLCYHQGVRGQTTRETGDSHCYHCGGEGHWANKCSELAKEQQAQLHMTVEGMSEEDKQAARTAHEFFHASMVQGEELPDWQAYLDGCSTVTAFKNKKHLTSIHSKKHLMSIHTVARGVKINCNAGNLKTNQQGEYGTMKVWYIPEGIANIFSMNKLKNNIASPTTVGKGTMWCIPKMDQ
jgi:hypothetical protein